MSVALSKLFLFKCSLPILRLTPLVTLLSLPLLLSRLLSYQRRVRPPQEMFSPTLDSITLSMFPIVWFFGFLYYTDVPSLAFVLVTFLTALQEKYWLSSLVSV